MMEILASGIETAEYCLQSDAIFVTFATLMGKVADYFSW